MSFTAIILLVVSACVHAGWNLVCKRQHPTQTFFFLAGAVGVLLFIPVALCYWAEIQQIPSRVWLLLLASGFFMALYYIALAGAYRTGDMSIAYPLARSSPILVVTFVSLVMGRGHEIGRGAVVGIVLVVLGCFLLPMRRFTELRLRNYWNACCLLALLAAIGTAGYTIIDDRALAILCGPPDYRFRPMAAAFVYLFLEAISSLFWQGLGLLATGTERRSFLRQLPSQMKPAAIAGAGIFLAYGLALTAMAFVRNVSYVAAFRQLSIPIGAGLGIVLLKEPCYTPRLVGIATILAGLLLVGLG